MSTRTPKLDHSARAPAIQPPEPADYSDELSKKHIDALRRCAPQDERRMGPLVHEFRW